MPTGIRSETPSGIFIVEVAEVRRRGWVTARLCSGPEENDEARRAPAGEKRNVGRDLRRDEGKERSREIGGRGGELELVGHAGVCGGFGARKKLELLLKNAWGRN